MAGIDYSKFKRRPSALSNIADIIGEVVKQGQARKAQGQKDQLFEAGMREKGYTPTAGGKQGFLKSMMNVLSGGGGQQYGYTGAPVSELDKASADLKRAQAGYYRGDEGGLDITTQPFITGAGGMQIPNPGYGTAGGTAAHPDGAKIEKLGRGDGTKSPANQIVPFDFNQFKLKKFTRKNKRGDAEYVLDEPTLPETKFQAEQAEQKRLNDIKTENIRVNAADTLSTIAEIEKRN